MTDTTNRQEQSLPAPQHPLPPGGHMPSLNLAGVDGLNVASGSSIQSMPDPGKPDPYTPVLHGSPDMGGIDPQTPIPVLNLAGVEGVLSPSQLVRRSPNQINTPDFGEPDFSQPELESSDLIEPGINYAYGSEFAPDPALPDMTEYRHPYGLDIHNQMQADLFTPDPLVGGGLEYDQPNGITISRDPRESDPLLPDMQQSQFTQDVHMVERPGDLDPSALEQMHLSPAYQQLGTVPYNQVFMDQSGMNSTRRRHYDLLMRGLDGEE
jgi:hypothetical protein